RPARERRARAGAHGPGAPRRVRRAALAGAEARRLAERRRRAVRTSRRALSAGQPGAEGLGPATALGDTGAMATEDAAPEQRPGVPASPSGRVPAWVVEEAYRAQVSGSRPNFGPFSTTPSVGAPTYLGSPDGADGVYVLPFEEPPRRSLAVRLGAILAVLALGLVIVFGANRVLNPPVPAELLGSYAERTDLPAPLAMAPPRDYPRPGFEERAAPRGTPGELARPSDAWAYRDTYSQGGEELPVLWSPCRPIHFVVNPEGAPGDFV